QLLAPADHIPDIEEQNVEPSVEHEWPELESENTPEQEPIADALVGELAERITTDRLFVPYSLEGREMLFKALADPRLADMAFAFGTNADVTGEMVRWGIDMDILSYFSTTSTDFKHREVPRRIEAAKPPVPSEP